MKRILGASAVAICIFVGSNAAIADTNGNDQPAAVHTDIRKDPKFVECGERHRLYFEYLPVSGVHVTEVQRGDGFSMRVLLRQTFIDIDGKFFFGTRATTEGVTFTESPGEIAAQNLVILTQLMEPEELQACEQKAKEHTAFRFLFP